MWVVILAAKGSEAIRDESTNSHIQFKLLKRVKLHSNNDIFVASLSSLCGPCFVVYIKDYCTTQNTVTSTDNRTAYIVRPQN